MRVIDMGPAGSRARMEQLVDAHAAPLYRYAYRLTGCAADADDLTQETFCKAQARLGQLRDPDRAKSWLFSILRNAYLHRLRSDKQRRQVPLDGVDQLACNGSETALSEVEPDRLQEALDALPEIFRSPVILFYFEEFSYRDIAEQMDVPLGTVMSRLARAKAMLRDRLSQNRPPVGPEGGASL